ncbi:hypothetical protein E4U22_007737 [Claviceps purpurea]|nr:hypothetical protein E4U47_006812 [Claviceps purpurea]KAG6315574.1 hypothetical protein E4U22_007737 [Claviceps purpurea]
MHTLNLLALLLPLVAAGDHFRCDCRSLNKGGNPTVNLTEWVCLDDFRDTAVYNDGLDECVATPGNTIDEMAWEMSCKDAAAEKC